MNSKDYIEKWLNGTLSDDELKEFKQTEDYQAIMKLDKAVQRFKAPAYDVEGELDRVHKRKKAKGKVVRVTWMQPMLRVAAIVSLALIGYYFIFFNGPEIISTGIAEKSEVVLPDQSQVTLNSLSSLSYDKNDWQEDRNVELTGEAYFKVAKGSKFNVNTSDGIITVLGTQFNVKVRENYFEVVCFEGLVAVESGQNKVELPPNHMFRIIDGEVFNTTDLTESAPSWLTNESSFVSVPYKFVIRELERQYDVSITTNNVDLKQLFTGRFTHENLSLAIKSISLPLNLEYKMVEDNQIELLGDIK